MEHRMTCVVEERDSLAEQNLTLVAVKADLKQQLSRYDEGNMEWLEDQASQLQQEVIAKVTEVEGLTKEKEDLQNDIEAWKVEVCVLQCVMCCDENSS